MKKRLSLILSSFVLFSIVSCNNQETVKPRSSKIEETSIIEDSSSNESSTSDDASTSSSTDVDTYYHVTFANYDDSVLYEVDVLEGTNAEYKGETPTREENDEFTYEFIGWDKELTDIQSNTTFIAQFKAVAKENWGPIHWF